MEQIPDIPEWFKKEHKNKWKEVLSLCMYLTFFIGVSLVICFTDIPKGVLVIPIYFFVIFTILIFGELTTTIEKKWLKDSRCPSEYKEYVGYKKKQKFVNQTVKLDSDIPYLFQKNDRKNFIAGLIAFIFSGAMAIGGFFSQGKEQILAIFPAFIAICIAVDFIKNRLFTSVKDRYEKHCANQKTEAEKKAQLEAETETEKFKIFIVKIEKFLTSEVKEAVNELNTKNDIEVIKKINSLTTHIIQILQSPDWIIRGKTALAVDLLFLDKCVPGLNQAFLTSLPEEYPLLQNNKNFSEFIQSQISQQESKPIGLPDKKKIEETTQQLEGLIRLKNEGVKVSDDSIKREAAKLDELNPGAGQVIIDEMMGTRDKEIIEQIQTPVSQDLKSVSKLNSKTIKQQTAVESGPPSIEKQEYQHTEILIDDYNQNEQRVQQAISKPAKTAGISQKKVRVGQAYFRQEVIKRFKGKCAITGVNSPDLLIASHIVPWSKSDDEARLDVDNGILLSPNYDALFDQHLISFNETGNIMFSNKISPEDIKNLGIDANASIQINPGMEKYLDRHRTIFRHQT